MTVFEALNRMRQLSEKQIPFAFSFMSYNRTNQTTHGIVEVRHAKLKPRAKAATYENAEIIEEYTDLDTNENRRFYHPTLMTFNGQQLQLK